jgi:branched-chain amino acid transport system substrate-binding protein
MKKKILIFMAVACSALVLSLMGCKSGTGGNDTGMEGSSKRYAAKERKEAPAPAQDKIVVGVYADLTGDNSTFGEETRNGVQLAVEEVNKTGGVMGKQVKVIMEDTRTDPTQARNVVTKLIQKDAVLAVIGEVASSMSLAGGPICDEYGVPMISPSSTNPQVTEIGEYIFRVCFIDPFQGEVMAKFARENLKVSKVAVLYDNTSDYSVGLADYFKQNFKKMGGTITGELTYKPADTDFRSQLTTIKGQSPEAIFIPGYYKSAGLIARQARELGITVHLLGGDGWSSPNLVSGAGGPGKALEGCYFSDHYSQEDPAPEIQEFVSKYKAKYGKVPGGLGALAYDAARLLFDAVERAGKLDRAAIQKMIAETKDFKGVTGNITIDKNGDATKAAAVLQIKGDKFTFAARVEPAM